jgi:ketosteroid isomerase-like protein
MEFLSALAKMEGETHVGIEGLRAWAAEIDAIFESFHIEIVDVRKAGQDRTVILYRNTGVARGSGIPIDLRTGQVWTWRDGRPWRNASFTDPTEALRAAGLSE